MNKYLRTELVALAMEMDLSMLDDKDVEELEREHRGRTEDRQATALRWSTGTVGDGDVREAAIDALVRKLSVESFADFTRRMEITGATIIGVESTMHGAVGHARGMREAMNAMKVGDTRVLAIYRAGGRTPFGTQTLRNMVSTYSSAVGEGFTVSANKDQPDLVAITRRA